MREAAAAAASGVAARPPGARRCRNIREPASTPARSARPPGGMAWRANSAFASRWAPGDDRRIAGAAGAAARVLVPIRARAAAPRSTAARSGTERRADRRRAAAARAFEPLVHPHGRNDALAAGRNGRHRWRTGTARCFVGKHQRNDNGTEARIIWRRRRGRFQTWSMTSEPRPSYRRDWRSNRSRGPRQYKTCGAFPGARSGSGNPCASALSALMTPAPPEVAMMPTPRPRVGARRLGEQTCDLHGGLERVSEIAPPSSKAACICRRCANQGPGVREGRLSARVGIAGLVDDQRLAGLIGAPCGIARSGGRPSRLRTGRRWSEPRAPQPGMRCSRKCRRRPNCRRSGSD